MKAISIRQPWAWLIANGHKDVENRSWHTSIRDPVLIHASKRFDQKGYNWVRHKFPSIRMPLPHEFERGGIVGIVRIVDSSRTTKEIIESPWYGDAVGWLLRDAAVLPFIPAVGQLSFFNVNYPTAKGGI